MPYKVVYINNRYIVNHLGDLKEVKTYECCLDSIVNFVLDSGEKISLKFDRNNCILKDLINEFDRNGLKRNEWKHKSINRKRVQ